MNEEKKILLQKKRQGTLTEAEYDQYLALIRSDVDFWEEARLERLIEDVLQEEADERRWEAVEVALSKKKDHENGRVMGFWPNFLVAASFTAAAFGAWWWWTNQQNQPRLLSNRATEIFASDSLQNGGRAYFGSNLPIGDLPTQWQLNPQQANAIEYLYCQDTLKLSLKTAADTVQLGQYLLFQEANTKQLFLQKEKQGTQFLQSCQQQQLQ